MSNAETCRRGHERTPENVRERILKRGGKEHVIRECRPCARLTAAARKAGVTPALLGRVNDAAEDAEAPCSAAELGCLENVAPWDGEYCSRSCEVADEGNRP